MKVASILATKSSIVFTIGPDQSLKEAVALLAEHNIGTLIVVDKPGQPIGIISERDIVREAAQSETASGLPVSQGMTSDVILASPEDDLDTVAQTMTAKKFRHLPVMDNDRLVGVISIGDVIKAQRDQYEGDVDTLNTRLIEDQA